MWHHADGRVRVIVGCGVWELPLQGAREVPRKAKPAEPGPTAPRSQGSCGRGAGTGQMHFLLLVSSHGLEISVLLAAAATSVISSHSELSLREIFKDNGQVDKDNHPNPR